MKKIFLFLSALGLVVGPLWSAQDKTSPPKTKASLKIPTQYVLEKVRGSVWILPKGAPKPERAREEQTLRAGDEIITQRGAEASLALNENTLFRMGPDSRVAVDKLSKKGSKGFTSRLKLWKGRLLAEVEKLRQSRSVFEVEAGGVLCGVRGTSFEVEADEKTVKANTYHGTVFLKKGGSSQDVKADRQAGFSLGEGAFLPQRSLTEAERRKYQDWLKEKAVLQRRQVERQAVLNSMAELTQEQKEELLQKLEGTPSQDRLRVMRQMLQEKYKENRRRMLEDASKKREEALRKSQEDAAAQRRKLLGNSQKLRDTGFNPQEKE